MRQSLISWPAVKCLVVNWDAPARGALTSLLQHVKPLQDVDFEALPSQALAGLQAVKA